MIDAKNTADVMVELPSLVRSQELLIGLFEKEPRPKHWQTVTMAGSNEKAECDWGLIEE